MISRCFIAKVYQTGCALITPVPHISPRSLLSVGWDDNAGATLPFAAVARERRTAGPYAPPDFLSRSVALAKFLRLSLRKAAYVETFSFAK
jgi:hypothetical protein